MPSGRRSSKRPWAQDHPELDVDRVRGGRRTESAADGEWVVQSVTGAAGKAYTCPGCRQQIGPGTAHVVAWATDDLLGPEAGVAGRRHWHSSCWSHRDRRR
ncbi:hypothetical protein ICW40_03955 [Actinotalea ferrariae]|uniref:hypothetical protein n=1 Tax=Actinotalea ferrariae TaxID=1386098 RepID=UPI001C8B26D0|nr:hypothetical protein [Actinotalea ferrariae]MBX9243960.1 hypothetical protein [Actinotalea ferrariae]